MRWWAFLSINCLTGSRNGRSFALGFSPFAIRDSQNLTTLRAQEITLLLRKARALWQKELRRANGEERKPTGEWRG